MRKKLLGLFCVCCVLAANAQNQESYIKKPTLAISGAGYDFTTAQRIRSGSLNTVLGNNQWSKLSEVNFALGINFIKGINEYLDYSVNFYSGAVKYPVRDRPMTKNEGFLHELDASLHLKLLTDKFTVVPYLSAGLGGSAWKGRFESFIPLGAGLQIKVIPDYFIFSNFQYRVPVTSGANYHFLYTLGFGAPVGKEKVPEVKAAPVVPVVAPPTPPADTDGDGIIDTEDKCPTVAGIAKYQGCPIPDTDGDGINDEEDKCPTVKGIAKYQGCPIPDTDGDGINDEQDKCPTVAGLARYQGCPIPDTDGDGINDEEDKCPTVAGLAELRGCPRPDFKGDNVLFVSGSATLVNTGKNELNKLVEYFEKFPNVKVLIEGHTDNTGSAALNQKLSENRAKAAKAYLVTKGVSEDRMTTAGYGFDKPVADNKTAAGRKLNRRVVFTIVD